MIAGYVMPTLRLDRSRPSRLAAQWRREDRCHQGPVADARGAPLAALLGDSPINVVFAQDFQRESDCG
jgi:hypothetical protein